MLSLFAFLFFLNFTSLAAPVTALHPLHLTVTELNYESAPRTMELTVKIFTDDFENILAKTYSKRADFYNKAYYQSMSEMVAKYVPSHLSIMTDNNRINFAYLGHEISGEAVYVYFQADKVAPFKKLTLRNTLLYDLFSDQIGFAHAFYDGRRQTAKVVQPEDQVVFDW